MKILIISDFHGKISILDAIFERFQKILPDIISFCGDVVQGRARGTAWLKGQAEGKRPDIYSPEIIQEAQEDHNAYQAFFKTLDRIGIPIIVVPGNMDAPEKRFFSHLFDYEMTLNNIRLVQENIFCYKEIFFSGFGGEITENQLEKDFVLQYPIQKAHFFMRKLFYLKGKKILILHTPPISKLDFEKGTHKGCDCVNGLIEWIKPDFVFCGHAHRARGEEWLGRTLVINPGPLKEGYFALLDTEGPSVRFEQIDLS
jgi:Icc-related predicted phosphoesterase